MYLYTISISISRVVQRKFVVVQKYTPYINGFIYICVCIVVFLLRSLGSIEMLCLFGGGRGGALDLALGPVGHMLEGQTYAGQVVRTDVSVVLVVPLWFLTPKSRQ